MPARREAPAVSDSSKIGSMLRAGRSESALEFEGSNPEISAQSSLPDLRHHSSILRFISTPATQMDEAPSLSSVARRPSNTPPMPSPLNTSSSQTSLGSDENGEHGAGAETTSSVERAGGLMLKDMRAGKRGKREADTGRNVRQPQKPPRQKSASILPSESLRKPVTSRPGTPKSVNDLGRDYSRYPSRLNLQHRSSPERRLSAVATALLPRTTTTQNPFNDSQADTEKYGYPDDRIGIIDPYCGGEKGFILYKNEVEADDRFHTPTDDDDIIFRPKFSEYVDRRSIVSTIGAIFLILGLLCIFIVFPVLTYTAGALAPSHRGSIEPAWSQVNNKAYPLLKNVRSGLIDLDTPASARTRKSIFDESTLELVFSDEFNDGNRTFFPGDDPYWTGVDLWYGATQDLEWYDPDAITTGGGTLQLKLDSFPNHNLQYRSGMLNSWNQLCFKGGVFEVSVSLAGPSGIPGLWPGVWSMGNLGRPGYLATTDGVWPYTYNSCDLGITPNQSSPDGVSYLPGQRLSSCTCNGEDHPNPGTGRGAPEIDVIEASVDPNNRIGVVTQSFQVAPFDVYHQPNSDFMAIPNYQTTQMNTYTGGPYQQAVSGTTLLNNRWYDGLAYQKYAFEYVPGSSQGKIAWFVGEDPSFIMDGRAIGPNGNVAARLVSQEPMSMVLNLGISHSWTQILTAELKFPTVMHVDYVRIYQPKNYKSVTCDPPGYPTTEFIQKHPRAYRNANFTHWDQTGYRWPKNKIMSGCKI